MHGPHENETHWFDEETGAATGDGRENDPSSAGFTEDAERFFRSHFQRVNRLADRSFEQVRSAYKLGYEAAIDARYKGQTFEEIEIDLENGWLNVRAAGGDWQSVREFAQAAFDEGGKQGRVFDMSDAGTTPPHNRVSFADPVPKNVDPTDPQSPEQSFEYQREAGGTSDTLSADAAVVTPRGIADKGRGRRSTDRE